MWWRPRPREASRHFAPASRSSRRPQRHDTCKPESGRATNLSLGPALSEGGVRRPGTTLRTSTRLGEPRRWGSRKRADPRPPKEAKTGLARQSPQGWLRPASDTRDWDCRGCPRAGAGEDRAQGRLLPVGPRPAPASPEAAAGAPPCLHISLAQLGKIGEQRRVSQGE